MLCLERVIQAGLMVLMPYPPHSPVLFPPFYYLYFFFQKVYVILRLRLGIAIVTTRCSGLNTHTVQN